jgi:hypothetical protein
MSLRDELAKHIEEYCYERGHVYPVELFGELADEVIRLMEWPRRGCDDPDWADRWDDKPMRPLTLPPDDWKP